MNQPLLFYSPKCPHCKEILSILQNTKLNIKPISIEQMKEIPSFLKVVPTIVIDPKSPPITGSKVFEWFNTFVSNNTTSIPQSTPDRNQIYQDRNQPITNQSTTNANQSTTNANQSDSKIVPFFNNEMSGFSDSYSYIGNDAPINHSYQFLNESTQNQLSPGQEQNQSNMKVNVKEKEFKKQYESMKESRKNDALIPNSIKRV